MISDYLAYNQGRRKIDTAVPLVLKKFATLCINFISKRFLSWTNPGLLGLEVSSYLPYLPRGIPIRGFLLVRLFCQVSFYESIDIYYRTYHAKGQVSSFKIVDLAAV